MTDRGTGLIAGHSYVQLKQEIDMKRIKRLDNEYPRMPVHQVLFRGQEGTEACGSDLKIREHLCSPGIQLWGHVESAGEFYLPASDRYNISVSLNVVSSPVVQWREGLLNIRIPQASEVVIMPPYRPMYFRTFEQSSLLHLSVLPEVLSRAAGTNKDSPYARLRNCFGARDPVIAELFRALLSYTRTPNTFPREVLDSVGMGIVFRLLELHVEKNAPVKGKLNPQQLKIVDDYLHGYLGERVSLESLSELLEMSPFQFHKQFKAALGMPPMRYCLQLRMRQARMLVEGTRRPIGDIAAEVGCPDFSHFTKLFRKHWGVTATALRSSAA